VKVVDIHHLPQIFQHKYSGCEQPR
jgi:hypothetical protein